MSLTKTVVASDGVIELQSLSKSMYYIYECGKKTPVGEIYYREGEYEFIGNIGYVIYEQFRGHNYAFAAFKLLLEILKNDGIDSVIVTARKENLASIKIIEKMDCEKVETVNDNIYTYRVYTGINKENKL